MYKQYRAVLSSRLSKKEERYVRVNLETGEIILMIAEGYGFKSKHAAYACFGVQIRG
ncbi:hypothetical protein ODV97_19655 [Enterococcus gallinarum]|nr:hypothetical protein [Enterococcus gallinarum]